jgi:hypothetical protein
MNATTIPPTSTTGPTRDEIERARKLGLVR